MNNRRHSRAGPPGLLVALLACVVLAWAAPAAAVDKAAAESLFRAGKALMGQGAYADACEKFRESHSADPSVGALLNLALCNEKQGKIATAWASYREAAAMAGRQRDRRRQVGASELADALEPKLSRLTVTVTMAHAGLEVTRNGEPVAAIGTALPIDPGTHTIAARAPGYEIWSTTISVGKAAKQETVTVPALTPKPEQPDSGSAVGSDGAGPAWQTVAGVVALGVGVVGLGVGITFGVLAAEGESDLSDPSLCPDKVCKPGAGTDALATVETQATVATVGVVVGSLAVIGGTVLLLLSPDAEQGDALLLPALGPASAGLVFSTRF